MDNKNLNPEIQVTRLVNISDARFVFYLNKQPIELEIGEIRTFPIYVAQHGAKHLVDKILQEKHGVKDTLRDTPLRRSIFAQILPDMAAERDIKPLSKEDEAREVKKMQEDDRKTIAQVLGMLEKDAKADEARDAQIAELKAIIENMRAQLETPKTEPPKKGGRPKKEEPKVE